MRLCVRSLLTLGTLIAATLIAPAVASAANCETEPLWTGTGSTTTVPAGGSIQTAINNTPVGGTVLVPNGTYSTFTLSKNVRVVAQNRYGATVNGSPRFTAGWIEGIRFPNASVNADGSGTITFKGNQILNGPVPGQEFRIFRSTGKAIVWGNDFRDPHFGHDNAVDYAVQMYGTVGAEVCHNYTYGNWHQAISFKEGNRDYSIAYNTIEGCDVGTCIFVGQNPGDNGLGYDTGLIQVHHNRVQRAVSSTGGLLYHARDPIRIGYVSNGDVRVYDNVVIGPLGMGMLIWQSGSGRIAYTNNAVFARANGTVDSVSACILRTGGGYTITSDRLQCYDAPVLSGGGVTMTNTTTGSRNITLTAGPNPRFDPDLSLLGGSPPRRR